MISTEALLVLIGWLISLLVALTMGFYIIPRVAAARICRQFGLVQVDQGGEEIFAVIDPATGKPTQVPIGMKGEEIVWGYAGLAYTLPFLASEMAVGKFQTVFLNTLKGFKGNISQKLTKEALASGQMDIESMELFLPKKAQTAIAIAKALGFVGNNGAKGGSSSSKGGGSFKPGL